MFLSHSLWSLLKLNIAGGLVVIGSAAMASAEQRVPPEGFTALFNGEDLTDWKGW